VLKDWNKAVISMKTKDKALQIVRENIKEQESDKLKYTSQISRYKELIQKEVFDYSEFEHKMESVKMKQRVVINRINDLEGQNKTQEQKRIFILQSIKKTNSEIKSLEDKEQNLLNQIDLIEKNRIKLHDMTRKLHSENLITLSTKDTHEKQTQNMIKTNNKLMKDKFNLQVEIDLKNNEISRVEIDELNVETQNESISSKIKLMNKEIEKLEKQYKKDTDQIKKNHEDLEKKQLQVDRLNKQYGHLRKNKGSEDEGFFEVKIKELQSDIINLTNKITNTEENWIKKKTSLVNKVNALNTIKDNQTDMRSKKLILGHKKLRLTNQLTMHEKEIRDVEISLKNLNSDMEKYNGMLSKNVKTKD
jgi:chromosome segregation ATPase